MLFLRATKLQSTASLSLWISAGQNSNSWGGSCHSCHWACSLTDMRRFHMFHMFHLCQNWGPISPINHNDVPLVLYISLTEKGPYPQQLEIVILKSERLVFYLHASHAATKHCTSAPVISKSVAAIAARRKQSSNATAFWKRLHTTSTASQRRQAEESSLEDKENTLGDLSASGSRNSTSYRQRKFAPRPLHSDNNNSNNQRKAEQHLSLPETVAFHPILHIGARKLDHQDV